uniref:Transposase Tc1-like domain-containing protein n=1 Tax=Oncorhynchus kisutch TaxID=8019 RepID=A0A8C7MRE4_ONCKI
QTDHYNLLKRSGRAKATTESEDKFLRVNSLRDRWLIEQQLQAQLNTGRSQQVSVSTVKRRLRAAGLTGRVTKKRLVWATKHRQWTTEDWKTVLWTDEIFGSSYRVFHSLQTWFVASTVSSLGL